MMKNIHQYLCLTLCFLITAAFGYCLQALRERPASVQSSGKQIGLDYFMSVQSFSEIENARAHLHALAARSLQELRHRRIAAGRADLATDGRDPRRDQEIGRLIEDFHSAIHEFSGTSHEWLFVQDLLWLLKNEGHHEEWITLYLHTLYQQPTHEMVWRFAAEAVRIGQVIHREDDVLEAIDLLRDIPGGFALHAPVRPAAAGTASRLYVVRTGDRTWESRSMD